MIKRLLLSAFILLSALFTFAQVTTGTITGNVTDSKGAPLAGATVKAVHIPTGTVYTTTSTAKGNYTLPNLGVGGPYSVTVNYVGHGESAFDNLVVVLANPLVVDAVLQIQGQTLGEVAVVGASRNGIITSQRTGPSTNISLRQIQSLPTLNRSVFDFARLTPQAVASTSNTDGSPMGISFAGQNNRYNQFTVDGASASDVFGLAATGTNGGQAGINPIPLESIADVQILLSPYDVTLGGFTGGGINAVTKSGTNTLHGSVYGFLQNQNIMGKGVTTDLKYAKFKNNTYGASLGGAIIKNKLFYFVNFERFDNSTPLAFDPSQANSGSKFNVATLDGIHDFLKKTYNYEAGDYKNINKKQYSTSVFARIDYNISSKSRLTIRHSYVDGSNYIISRSPTLMTFSNGGYYMKNTTNSTVAELNTTFSSRSSNVLRVTYNNIRDSRQTSPFPNVQIVQDGLTYNFGADFSSSANSLAQDNFTLTDNFTMYRDNHTITVGTNEEFYNTNNVFLQAYNGAYTYNRTTPAGFDNIGAFENNNSAPTGYTLNYSPTNPGDKAPAKIHAAQFSVYGQDVWAVKSNFKLTYGLRIDLPVYFNKPTSNDKFNSDPTFAGLNNAKVPNATPLFSPRAGFNWDIKKDGKTQLRGGAGLFTGRAPFVWISNQYGTNGVSTIRYAPSGATFPADLRFNYDPKGLLSGAYVPSGNTPPPTEVDITDKKFKVPQTFRANLAVDQKLPWWGLIGTIEGIYTKKINDINYQNLNVGPEAGSVTIGGSTRPWYNFKRINQNFTDVVELTNTSKGYAYNATIQIQKPYTRGWQGSIAYTYGHSTSLNDATSSVAMSNWRFAYNKKGLNYLDLTTSNYDPGSRIVGFISKTFTYANNHLATTIGLVYTGQNGQPISYTYTKNINGDDVTGQTGNNNANMIYVPNATELNDPNGYQNYKFVDITTKNATTGVVTVVRTAAQQWADFKSFVENNKDLKDNEGKIIDRNASRTPWENHFDLKVSQDFIYKQHRIQISIDILNVGNLIDKKSGWSYGASNQDISPLTVITQGTNPTFNFDQSKMNLINGVYRGYFVNDLLSRWRSQLSLRYSF